MKFKDQALLLNMYKHDEIYEKTVDQYKILFVLGYMGIFKRKKPCLVFMMDRAITQEEQLYILKNIHYKKMTLYLKQTVVKNDTICMYIKMNNRNIDYVMHLMYEMVQIAMTLNIAPLDEKTYKKYRYSFSHYVLDKKLIMEAL